MLLSDVIEVTVETEKIMIVKSITGEECFKGKIYGIPEGLKNKIVTYLSGWENGIYTAIE